MSKQSSGAEWNSLTLVTSHSFTVSAQWTDFPLQILGGLPQSTPRFRPLRPHGEEHTVGGHTGAKLPGCCVGNSGSLVQSQGIVWLPSDTAACCMLGVGGAGVGGGAATLWGLDAVVGEKGVAEGESPDGEKGDEQIDSSVGTAGGVI